KVPDTLALTFSGNIKVDIPVKQVELDELLQRADFISLHVPFTEKPILTKDEFAKVKRGVGIVNASRGGVLNETDLIDALNSGQVGFAGLDVFENEPTPRQDLLSHPKISLTPHIGAATNEAQERIGEELAGLIIDFFQK